MLGWVTGEVMSRPLRSPYREVHEELPNLVQLGAALWADPQHGEKATLESISAVLMLDLSGPRLLEKISGTLLARAQREGVQINASGAGNPFYRMRPEERLILSGLRVRWSYDRLAAITGATREKVQEIAWAARLHLVYSPGSSAKVFPQGLIHPTGSMFRGYQCPDYHPGRPWTQRFLDEEMTGEEKHFLQGHLVGCDPCRKALGRARTLYYAAARSLPEVPIRSDDFMARLEALNQTIRHAVLFKHPGDRTLGEALRVFVRRTEIQLLISAMVVLLAYKLL